MPIDPLGIRAWHTLLTSLKLIPVVPQSFTRFSQIWTIVLDRILNLRRSKMIEVKKGMRLKRVSYSFLMPWWF